MNILKLPIRVQQEIKSYTQFALPMCVVFTEKKFHPWILKNFMEIKSSKTISENGNHFQYAINNTDGNDLTKMAYGEVLDVTENRWDDIVDHVGFIRSELKNGFYVHHQLDEFQLAAKGAYKKNHFLHPSLIYGFCDGKREFYAVGFAGANFKEFVITYDEMSLATLDFDKELLADSHRKQTSYSYRLKTAGSIYDFSLTDLRGNLERYISSPDINGWIYGLGGYQLVLDNLVNPYESGCYLKYNTTHFLCEHKKIFNLALDYIFSKGEIKCEIGKVFNEHKKIVSTFDKIRLMHMDFVVKGNHGVFVSTQDSARKMHSVIKEAYEMELRFFGKLELFNFFQISY